MNIQLSKIIRPLPPIPQTPSGFGRMGCTNGMELTRYRSRLIPAAL
jgi:hypothetical protein